MLCHSRKGNFISIESIFRLLNLTNRPKKCYTSININQFTQNVGLMRADRRRKILELITQNGQVSVTDLIEMFQVSEMTARRDLADLAREGLLRRVHGGATINLGRSYEPPYPLRTTEQITAKQAIGKAAAALIQDGDSVAFDVGTTTLEIARSLTGKQNLTIVTASLPIANEIVSRYALGADMRLLLTGGIVRAGELSMVGEFAAHAYHHLHVDKAFIGIGGISRQHGLTEYNLDDALVKRAIIATASQVIIVADSSKFGRTTFAHVAPLKAVKTIVTDRHADLALTKQLQDMAIEVIFADT
jgi:DeoR/GlpR family transcriptional regulator of sugar metabolism